MTIIHKYPKSCESCANYGLFTCKKILNPNGTCMFYKKDNGESIDIFLKYYESKQRISSTRSKRD